MPLYTVTVSGEALAAATVETIAQIVAPAARRLTLVRWGVSFNGADVTKVPVRVELLRLTSAGSSSAFTPVKMDPTDEAATATARVAHTVEPTASDVLEVHFVTPAGGNLIEYYGPEERPTVQASGRLGIRVLANDAVNVNCFLTFEE